MRPGYLSRGHQACTRCGTPLEWRYALLEIDVTRSPVAVPPAGHPDVSLRWLQPKDAHAWYAVLRLPEVTAQTSWSLASAEDLKPILAACGQDASASQVRLAIVDTEGALAGSIGFHSINSQHGTAEIAYELAPDYWRRGIASAVCDEVVAWAWQRFGWQRIQASVLDTNAASAGVLRRCGFNLEGRLRRYRRVAGVSRDFDVYSRLAEPSGEVLSSTAG